MSDIGYQGYQQSIGAKDSVSDKDVEDFKQCLQASYLTLCELGRSESISGVIQRLLGIAQARLKMDGAVVVNMHSDCVGEVVAASENVISDAFLGCHIGFQQQVVDEVTFSTLSAFDKATFFADGEKLWNRYNSGVNGYVAAIALPSEFIGEGILFLFSEHDRKVGYTQDDIQLIQLLAEGIACMIDLQNTLIKRSPSDVHAFANGSVKTLEEYLTQAKIPELVGVPARVLDVLRRRIGTQPLGIAHVAEELNLSKRTLQRRLQQQDVNFAELRDQVRFHHSIDYLIKQHMSIDSISSSLDFSDRTSFTNAFKRWTGLSPSTFRKLFRDYV